MTNHSVDRPARRAAGTPGAARLAGTARPQCRRAAGAPLVSGTAERGRG